MCTRTNGNVGHGHASTGAFTGERRFVDKHVLRRLIVQQHGVLLNAPFDGHGRLADLAGQPSQAAGDDAERQGLGQQPYVPALPGHVLRHPGQRPSQLGERRRPEHGHGHVQRAPTTRETDLSAGMPLRQYAVAAAIRT